MSIKKSLQGSILFMAVIPVILMAILAYVVTVTKYANITKENTIHTAEDYSRGLVSQLQTQIVEAQAIADTNNVKTYLLEKVNAPDTVLSDVSSDSIKDSMTQLSKNFNDQVNYYIYDVDGYLTISSSSDSNFDWSEIMKDSIDSYTEATVISQSEFSKGTLDIIVPVIVKKKVIGLVRANITASYFNIFLSNNDSNSFIIDADGNCLFQYDASNADDTVFLNHIETSILPEIMNHKDEHFFRIKWCIFRHPQLHIWLFLCTRI